MTRRRKRKDDTSVIPVVVLLVVGIGISFNQSKVDLALTLIILLLIIILIGLTFLLIDIKKKEKLSRSGILEIDKMSGLEFERYLQVLLLRRGYSQIKLTTTYDLGVDLIAKKDGDTWAIQAKRYKGAVGLDAVRQVVAAKNHYNCTKAMVITNSYFTRNAQVIAKSADCVLVDREKLINLILSENLR